MENSMLSVQRKTNGQTPFNFFSTTQGMTIQGAVKYCVVQLVLKTRQQFEDSRPQGSGRLRLYWNSGRECSFLFFLFRVSCLCSRGYLWLSKKDGPPLFLLLSLCWQPTLSATTLCYMKYHKSMQKISKNNLKRHKLQELCQI